MAHLNLVAYEDPDGSAECRTGLKYPELKIASIRSVLDLDKNASSDQETGAKCKKVSAIE